MVKIRHGLATLNSNNSVVNGQKHKVWVLVFLVEFDWDPDHLSNEPPLEGPPIPITIDMVKKAISKMK